MSVLIVGISHRSAPVAVLERLALDADAAAKLAHDVQDQEHVSEATVLATCNRVEIYADVTRFHGSVEAVSRLLCERAGGETEEFVPHLYVHYDDGAVAHLFNVASGLDSMVVGESQVLGQVRDALRSGQEGGTLGSSLNLLFQQALRVGKRSHAETDIDRFAPSLVSASLSRAARLIGDVAGKRVLVVGAGSMSALAVSTAARAGAVVTVANRTAAHGDRLALQHGVRAVGLSDLAVELTSADVVVSCTAASGRVLTTDQVRTAREGVETPLMVLDLALPHDVEAGVGALPGVSLINLATLADELADDEGETAVADVRGIVTEELAAFLSARHAASVTPTVVALRGMATGVVETEMTRLDHRLPNLDPAVRDEVLHTLRRVTDKLLHQPTVRVKQLANSEGAVSYAAALAELFALDPEAVDAVTRPDGIAP
ncbi:glutamyl-tRNA reductase [Nocardioides mangrovicus]|uniref:Glutamyl-tRNA reductase n=1 Tax=Nocardioides mangrovicus TaxID=2478913 RepID=A0A3L8P548_9ACTN|nr:glutamyl-tRNA reductase [Nocardioides mangrovicus]RLV50490.1 glutamyl-tRNA reductase [Nocardioides mangrovicus]